MQIECLLPKAKVTFTKFGERYCLSANYFPKAYYGSKYDGEISCNFTEYPANPEHKAHQDILIDQDLSLTHQTK